MLNNNVSTVYLRLGGRKTRGKAFSTPGLSLMAFGGRGTLCCDASACDALNDRDDDDDRWRSLSQQPR